MFTLPRFSGTDPREAAQHFHTNGLPVIPLDPVHLKPAVDQAAWLPQLSDSTIAAHWAKSPADAVGYVIPQGRLVVRAGTATAADALHALGEKHGVTPFMTTLGQGGETWHVVQEQHAGRRSSPLSGQLIVLQPGDITPLLLKARTEEDVAGQVAVSASFLNDLIDAARALSDDDTPAADAQEMPAVTATAVAPAPKPKSDNPMARFSITGMSSTLSKLAQAQVQALGRYAMLGQATALYAAPNTGKTLIVLHDLGRSILAGKLNASKVFYFNLDDNSAGLIAKLHEAEKYGFNMLADGFQGFSSRVFLQEVQSLIGTPHPSGMVIILDTVKKVADLMDKRAMAEFTAAMRRFVMKGGTVIALAHTNKHGAANGRPIYAGTSDLVDDFDCAYTLQALPSEAGAKISFVELKNFKQRGGVADEVVYSYSRHDDYTQLLASVREVSDEELAKVQRQAERARNADAIEAIKAAIQGGDVKRMELADTARQAAQVSRAELFRVLDLYAGDDSACHLWRFTVAAKGAKVYSLHEDSTY